MPNRRRKATIVMDPAIVGIAGLLRQFHLHVPNFQRNYSWGGDEVKEYIEDISDSRGGRAADYFLGTVVLAQRPDGSLEVIDGQQRLATTYMLIAAIRNRLSALGAKIEADDLDKGFLNSLNLQTARRSPKLSLNVDDNALFASLVAAPPGPAQTTPKRAQGTSNRKLISAWSAILNHIDDLAKAPGPTSTKELLSLAGYLDVNAKVIRLIVPDEISAYTVFETLNDRGLELAVADLLKNYLYSRAGKHLDEVSAAWNQMTGKLNVLKERDVIVQFVSHFWASKHGLTRRRELLAQAKKSISTAEDSRDIAVELRDNADTYLAITDPNAERWKGKSKDRSDAIRVLSQTLRIIQIRPLLLSVADAWREGEQVKAFRLLVNCAVRVLVAGARGGTIERLYNDTAAAVRKGTIKNTLQLREQMRKSVPADDRFREEFAALRVSRSEVARYYLAAIERSVHGSAVRDDDPKINLEHVLPEEADLSQWPSFTSDQHRAYRYSIGNLCLLRLRDNSKIGNTVFANKVPTLQAASFRLTNEVAAQSDWTPKIIESRATALANLAVDVWPVDAV